MRTTRPTLGEGAFGPEPAHDAQLGRALAEHVGAVPMGDVDWSALASRISASVAGQVPTAWWDYATRWERRMLPLAIAAGLAGAFTLWSTSPAAAQSQVTSASAVATAVASGTPAEDAASMFAHAVTLAGETIYGAVE